MVSQAPQSPSRSRLVGDLQQDPKHGRVKSRQRLALPRVASGLRVERSSRYRSSSDRLMVYGPRTSPCLPPPGFWTRMCAGITATILQPGAWVNGSLGAFLFVEQVIPLLLSSVYRNSSVCRGDRCGEARRFPVMGPPGSRGGVARVPATRGTLHSQPEGLGVVDQVLAKEAATIAQPESSPSGTDLGLGHLEERIDLGVGQVLVLFGGSLSRTNRPQTTAVDFGAVSVTSASSRRSAAWRAPAAGRHPVDGPDGRRRCRSAVRVSAGAKLVPTTPSSDRSGEGVCAGRSRALGRNRTCDPRFRKPLLSPLSYEGVLGRV